MRSYRWNLIGENIDWGKKRLTGSKRVGRGLRFGLVLVFSWLASRAFFLQVVLGEMNAKKAEANRIETRAVAANRGVIEDRQGRVLARNSENEVGEMVREYPLGEAVAHVVGYVGKGEVVWEGKAGIEKSFNERLAGRLGEAVVEENARGEELRKIIQEQPKAGEDLRLTIDSGLQKRIVRVLADREAEGKPTWGAVVVSKVESGEILALVSWPEFDSNWFGGGKSLDGGRYQSVEAILKDKKLKPLFNRAISGGYPPGSVFKLITAAAALEEGEIDATTLVEDTGEIKVGEYRFGTWNFDQHGKKEGLVDIVKALSRSNDIFFYKAGEWVGIDMLANWSGKFGLGKLTQIDIPGEVAGVVPDREKKERLTGERWFLGNTYHTAIGQGDTLVTPLQVNMYTAAVISGKYCRPKMVLGVVDVCSDLGLSKETKKTILEGMKAACQGGGTAFPFFSANYVAACKTGTAQHGGEKTLPHAWITLVVPRGGEYDEGMAITVLLEEAGEGSYEAGPVARAIADYVVEILVKEF